MFRVPILGEPNVNAILGWLDQPPASETDFSFQKPDSGSFDAAIWFRMIRHYETSPKGRN